MWIKTPSIWIDGGKRSVQKDTTINREMEALENTTVFLPLVWQPVSHQESASPRVNAPFFPSDVSYPESAIFWFGRITRTENYADIRIGYNSTYLSAYVTIFDRFLWRDPTPTPGELLDWDALEMYLDLNPTTSGIDHETYRFIGQLNWWEPREAYQAAYVGSAGGWQNIQLPFETFSGWRGNAPNDDYVDHGWLLMYSIPFSSLGLSSAPTQGTNWKISLNLYDRDDQIGTPIQPKTWPPEMLTSQTDTWATLHFGLPAANTYQAVPTGSTIIRQGENGLTVPDGMVGGAMDCGSEIQDRWTEWGEVNYPDSEQINIQNEDDVSDWVCFSKYYISFPLHSLPSGKQIISATLTLHMVGNAGGGSWGPAPDSFIQVLSVGGEWNEETLNWNNAPLPLENISQARVPPITVYPGAPGVPQNWDVTYAVQKAYAQSIPLRLALYSADVGYHTGKYFSSSDLQDFDPTGRPTLLVTWGEAAEER